MQPLILLIMVPIGATIIVPWLWVVNASNNDQACISRDPLCSSGCRCVDASKASWGPRKTRATAAAPGSFTGMENIWERWPKAGSPHRWGKTRP
jgi:hypothetical protein